MTYNWTDNPTEAGVANYDPDVLNENLMHLKYDNSGGVSKFENLGTVTTNKTLTQDKISVGYWSGSNTISLPTVTDTTKQVECVLDFTTATTSSPSINQYKALTGTIAITNGSANVTGTGTLFATEIKAGDKILIASVEYTVSSVTSNTTLVLTANYAGTTASGLSTSRKFIRWSSLNQGKAPTAYSILNGVRNEITFKSIWEGGLLYWQTEYNSYGGVETTFIQQTLSDNGSMGGANQAVSASYEDSSHAAYMASDANDSTIWQTLAGNPTGFYTRYNPSPVKASSIDIKNYNAGGYSPSGGSIYGSNDNSNYTLLTSYTNSNGAAGAVINIPIPSGNQGFYNYYKTTFTGATSGNQVVIAQLTINGTYIVS